MLKFFKTLLVVIVLIPLFFVQQVDFVSAASSKSNSVSSWKTYIRSGRFPGGFTFYTSYSEVYSNYSSSLWKITSQSSYNTLSDEYLSLNGDDQSTKYYVDDTLKYTITNFYNCSSYIADPSKYTICREKANIYYATKYKTSAQHTSNVILPTNYYPQIFTNKVTLSY